MVNGLVGGMVDGMSDVEAKRILVHGLYILYFSIAREWRERPKN